MATPLVAQRLDRKKRAMKPALNSLPQIVALDIGTSKIVIMVADVLADGSLQVRGIGQQASDGCMRKGMVVNIDATVEVINAVIKESQLMSAKRFSMVWTGVAGGHIKSANSEGVVAIRDQEVTLNDMERALETAKAVPISNEMQVLHTIAQEYVVDNQEGVADPLGMAGVRLKVKVHIVTGAVTSVSNIVKCITRCGLQVADITLQPLASAAAVLTRDEKELGVVLVDIGGGTTDIAIFSGGSVRHTAVIPVAGDHVTNDIAMALRTPTADAEELKLRWGVAKTELVSPSERLEVPGLGDREPRMISRMALSSVIEPRVEELFTLVQQVVQQSGCEHLLSSGVVLTGGSALMPGMQELAEDVFARPVRVGMPIYNGSLADVVRNPRYATVMGLLIEAKKKVMDNHAAQAQSGGIGEVMNKMKRWFF
jgi:cell division protein FtsA